MLLDCTLSIMKTQNLNDYGEKVRKGRIYKIKIFVRNDKQ